MKSAVAKSMSAIQSGITRSVPKMVIRSSYFSQAVPRRSMQVSKSYLFMVR